MWVPATGHRLLARLAVFASPLPLFVLLAASAQPPDPGAPQAVRVLYPSDRSVHTASTRLIVATPLATTKLAATLDGRSLPLRRMTFAEAWVTPGRLKATSALVGDRAQAALWCAPLTLKAGPHTLVLGTQRIMLRGGKEGQPTGWTTTYAHGPVSTTELGCAGCHEMTATSLGAAPTPRACACHGETDVQLVHKHVAQPLARCAMCHDPHGALRPKLLVDAKEKLCSKCHELGHSKD